MTPDPAWDNICPTCLREFVPSPGKYRCRCNPVAFPGMTPQRFRTILLALDWSQRGLASHLGIADTRARRWANGQMEIPESVATWLEKLASVHEAHPLPEGWQKNT